MNPQKKNGGRIVAIGTTVLRALESSFFENKIKTGYQETNIFIKPGYKFKLVDSLGATEAYPFTGSSEIIVDITSTGETLKANNLRILKDGEILKSEACMMISKLSVKKPEVKKLIKLLSKN